MVRRLKIIFVGLILVSIAFAFPQIENTNAKLNDTKPQPLPFQSDEELYFLAEFSKAVLRGLDVAELRLKVTKQQETSKTSSEQTPTLYNLIAETKSKGFAPKLFGINFYQYVDSTVDPSTFRVLKDTKIDQQNKRVRKSETLFDKENGKLIWTETNPNQPNSPPRVVTTQLNGEVQDLASAFYYLRMQPLKVGEQFTFKLHDSGQIFDVPVKVTERKQMKTVLGKVWTIKIEPDIFGKLIDGEGEAALWFTDDARRIPVRFEIKHRLGTVDFKLKKMSTPK